MFEEIKKKLEYLSFGRTKQQAFVEDLSTLIEDGVPAQQAVVAMHKVSEGAAQEVAQSVINAMASGKPLADGMEGWFPHYIVEVIRTGEEGGSLQSALQSASSTLSQSVSVVSSFISSMLYPVVVLIIACIVAVFLKNSIFVNFSILKPVSSWPENGRQMYYIASFLESYWWLIMVAVILLIALFFQLFRKLIGEVRNLVDNLPPFSFYKVAIAARFMETLGLLTSNGITLKDALIILQRDTTRFLMWHLYMMQVRLAAGKDNIAEVLDTGLLAREDILRLMVIAQGKGFDYALVRLGARAMQKSTKKLQLIAKICGGVFLAIDALFAIFMILAMYSVGMSLGVAS